MITTVTTVRLIVAQAVIWAILAIVAPAEYAKYNGIGENIVSPEQ
jgi:hypothetical protein